MRKLQIYIEIEGKQTYVGLITGDSPQDARFAYSDSYIAAGYPPISISLPISRGICQKNGCKLDSRSRR